MTRSAPRRLRVGIAVAAIAATVLVTTGCSASEDDEAAATEPITVWTGESQAERIAAMQVIIDAFTAESGIEVELVPIDETELPQLVAAAALAGDLPDVIGSVTLSQLRELQTQELLDTDIAADVVADLGADTFSETALSLTADGDTQLGVPSDAWSELIIYRTDRLEAAGVAAPETNADMLDAAAAMTADGAYGVVLGTDASQSFTTENFEALALRDGCQLVDDSGEVALDSAECADTFSAWGQMVQQYSPGGTQDVPSTRASYFSGQSSMVVWSSFILDELAGLRNDALPSCPECAADSGWLASNSGIIPAGLGEIVSWAVMDGASEASSQAFIEYMLSTGYLDQLAFAPEGKFPVRLGTAENPTEYIDGWAELPAGVDTKEPLGDVYPPEVIEALSNVTANMNRWGLSQGEGALLGSVYSELPLSQILSDLGAGTITAEEAAQKAQEAVEELRG
ncbi:MAG: ABC transporter substrate-binding protein [Protaetiibacter sp.]